MKYCHLPKDEVRLISQKDTVGLQTGRIWGRTGFDGDVEADAAGRGAAGLVKSGNTVIANNDYEYACAA